MSFVVRSVRTPENFESPLAKTGRQSTSQTTLTLYFIVTTEEKDSIIVKCVFLANHAVIERRRSHRRADSEAPCSRTLCWCLLCFRFLARVGGVTSFFMLKIWSLCFRTFFAVEVG